MNNLVWNEKELENLRRWVEIFYKDQLKNPIEQFDFLVEYFKVFCTKEDEEFGRKIMKHEYGANYTYDDIREYFYREDVVEHFKTLGITY